MEWILLAILLILIFLLIISKRRTKKIKQKNEENYFLTNYINNTYKEFIDIFNENQIIFDNTNLYADTISLIGAINNIVNKNEPDEYYEIINSFIKLLNYENKLTEKDKEIVSHNIFLRQCEFEELIKKSNEDSINLIFKTIMDDSTNEQYKMFTAYSLEMYALITNIIKTIKK